MQKNSPVCHMTSVHIPFDTRIFHRECASLQKAGYQVHLIAAHDGDEVINGIHIHGVPVVSGKVNRMFKTVRRVYRKAVSLDMPVYHFHDPELMFAGLLLKLHGKKVIMDVHEDYPDYIRIKTWIPAFLRIPVAWMTGVVEHVAARFFDSVITVTPKINNRFEKATGRSVMVRNFPVINEMDTDQEAPYPTGADDTVIYVGSITRDRGIEEMVRAMEIVQKTHTVNLVLGGSFAPASLEEDMRRQPGFSFVDYRGYLSREEMGVAMRSAKAGLVLPLPYSSNTFGYNNKLFEYMSAGLPVIASDFPIWKQFINDTGSGTMVDSRDPEAIAAAITYILDNPEEAAEMGRRGRKAIETTYNWETEAAKLIEVYENL